MTSSKIRFSWNSNTNLTRTYLSDILNFSSIRHKKAKIQNRKLTENYEEKMDIIRHCDLDLWPKVTNFIRVPDSAVSNHLVKTASNSKSSHLFGWNFVYWQTQIHTHTDRHTHRKLQWKYKPSMISWRCKKSWCTKRQGDY